MTRFLGDSERRYPRDAARLNEFTKLTLLVALVVVVVLLGGRRVSAMQLTPVQKQEMKQHYEKATRAYDVQKYNEAVEEYQKAYEIGGDPAMLYNVAQSYRLADQLPDALRFYRRYLQRSPNARNREDVERKIAELERTVEDRRRAAAAAAAVTAPVAPPPMVSAPAAPPAPIVHEDEGAKRVTGIVLTSVGAAALVTAAITGKMASDKGDKLTTASMQPNAVFDANLASVEKNGKTLNTVAIVSAVTGGVAAIAGVVLIVMSQGASGETAHQPQAFLSPVIGGSLAGAVATVRF